MKIGRSYAQLSETDGPMFNNRTAADGVTISNDQAGGRLLNLLGVGDGKLLVYATGSATFDADWEHVMDGEVVESGSFTSGNSAGAWIPFDLSGYVQFPVSQLRIKLTPRGGSLTFKTKCILVVSDTSGSTDSTTGRLVSWAGI